MQVNNYLGQLPNLDSPLNGDKPSNTAGTLSNTLNQTSSVVVSIGGAVGISSGAMTVSRFLASMANLSGPVNIADSAFNIAKNLDALNTSAALAKIGSVSQTGTIQNLAITYSQWLTDTNVSGDSVLDKLGANNNAAGSNRVIVSSVDDANLTTVKADTRVQSVGVINVAKLDLSDRISDVKISSIGVTDLSYPDSDLTTYASSLSNNKVTAIGVLNVPSANLNAVLANRKIKTATVTGVLAKDVASIGGKAQVTGMTVADTSLNLANNFNGLLSRQSKITTVTQSSTPSAMELTGAQFKAGSSLLAKFDSGAYTVNLKTVRTDDVGTFATQSTVLSMEILDSGINISKNFSLLGDAGTLAKISKITQSGVKDSISITAAQFSGGSSVLSKISGNYSLAISNAAFSNLTTLSANSAVRTINLTGVSIANIATAAANAKVKSIQVSDTASNVSDASNLTILKANTGKITNISNSATPSGTRDNVVFTPSTYDAKLADKLVGFSTAVDYAGPSSSYRITTDSKGLRTITLANGTKQTYANNVNFFKFTDKNLFGTSGNKNVDAILLGGTENWWYDSTTRATSDTQIDGVMNSLSSSSSKHALSFSFLTSATIAGASNAGSADATGFVEMNADQKEAVKKALDYISSVTNLTFSEAGTPGQGDLNFGTNNQGTGSAAYAYNPHTASHINVMLNNTGAAQQANATFAQGTYGWETLIHEIAHALGLKHPGNYNAGGGGTVGPYLPSGDAGSRRYTIMSYNNPKDIQNVTGTNVENNRISFTTAALNPETFMLYDIAALQFLYGVNTDAAGAQYLQTARTETASAVFKPLSSGQTITIAGLTFTAGSAGISATDLATAFSSIASNDTRAGINVKAAVAALTSANKGSFTAGEPAGWTTGSVGGTNNDTVVFTSRTANTNVQNLASSGTGAAPVITVANGVRAVATETASTVFKALTNGQSVTIAGLTFTAGSSGISATDLATAFSGITSGESLSTINSDAVAAGIGLTKGTFTFESGFSSLAWTTGSVGGTNNDTVVFTSRTANVNVQSLVATSAGTGAGVGTTPEITTAQGGVRIDDFQTTTFTSGWKGFESLYIPESQTTENLNLSSTSGQNIIDLRAGSFSSVNILPPSAKTDLPTSMLRSAQTYFGYNNVALAYGSEINAVTGGAAKDTYYVSDYNVTITDSSSSNQVYLNGRSQDWSIATNGSTKTYTNIQTGQAVKLVGTGFSVSYYDSSTQAMTHSSLDLMA